MNQAASQANNQIEAERPSGSGGPGQRMEAMRAAGSESGSGLAPALLSLTSERGSLE